MERGEKHLDTEQAEHAADCLSELISSSRLDQLDLDSSLSFLNDPASLLESTLATDTSLIPPLLEGGEVIDPSSFLNMNIGPDQGSHAHEDAAAVLNPPLSVSDISSFMSAFESLPLLPMYSSAAAVGTPNSIGSYMARASQSTAANHRPLQNATSNALRQNFMGGRPPTVSAAQNFLSSLSSQGGGMLTVSNALSMSLSSSLSRLPQQMSVPTLQAAPPAAGQSSASIPLLQFLQQNFPKIHDDLKGLIQSTASPMLGRPPQNVSPSVVPNLAPAFTPPKPAMAVPSCRNVPSMAVTSSRTPVFAQIISSNSTSQPTLSVAAKTPVTTPRPAAAVAPAASGHHPTTPGLQQLQQSRHPGTKPAPSHQVALSAAAAASPPTRHASPEGTSVGGRQPLSASQLSTAVGINVKMEVPTDANLRKTLVQSADDSDNVGDHGDGGGDIDVGLPIRRCEFPSHLREHNYCLYNPEEGLAREKRQVAPDAQFSCNIPPARLSYAPVIPESPATLYKLLKVQPTKSSTPRPRLSQGRLGARQRGSGRRGGGRGGGRSKSGSQAGSDESHGSSSDPEFADDGRAMNLSTRRRSQRNAGQRKHYVDDVELNISDDDDGVMDELEVVAKKRQYKGYRDDESEEDADGGRSKHKRTITVNPTEGFSYSDIFLDPPPEEANIVEKILLVRTRPAKSEEELQKYGDQVEEFLVKYKNYSYLHAEWATVHKLLVGDKRFEGKARRFKSKKEAMGVFASMDDEPFNPEYTMVDRVLDVATQVEPGGEVVTHYLVKWCSLPYEDSTWELEEDVDAEKIRIFNKQCMPLRGEDKEFKSRPPPALFRPIKDSVEYKGGNYLRPYQLEGLNWLLFNWYTRQNCILADEMGLGKTVQSIVFLMEVVAAGIRGPFLVIAPLSTIANWQREFESWSDLNVIIYHGSAYSRRMIHEYELYHRDSQGKIITNSYKFNAIVTTYEVILSDDSGLHGIEWRVVVIDEAHRLKNRNCKLLEGLKTLYMEHRVLLTGTPLQNSVDELFSLLNFLEPSTFPSHMAFLQKFGDLKTEEQVEELKAILKPMMLRRLKEDVEKSLAAKEETIIEVELTATQKQYYRAILERNFNFLSKGSGTTVPSLLNVMMELRKCCNHPFLIAGAEAKILQDFKVRHVDEPLWHALIQASGKLVLIDKLLPKLKQSGHKVLIFSQMVRCLDILEDYLRVQGYLYERIDGQVRGILRQAAIDRFSKPGSDRFVFLLCTRAGGLGINLTAADTVIIYDSDWNPQNDVQAQARCHRIGQSKAVKVYRLITRNSYEREMFDRASLKLGLDRAVLQSMNSQRDPIAAANGFSKKDVESLLKKGAYGLVMEEDDDANKFCEEDIDQILERRTRVIQLESEGKGSTFSKASFVADGSSDISIDDPDFWQKWAEKAKLDLNELANKDNLVLDTPRQRRQVRRYGNEHMEEIVDLGDDMMDMFPLRTSRRGWSKVECLKVEKGLLTYGWGQWRDILRAAKFKKRQLGLYDAESISRTILVYCLSHFTGDDKVRPYIHRLVDPSEDPEGLLLDREFTEEDFLAMLSKDPEALFPDDTYMKHLRRHTNKILLRIRQLHIIRWSMLAPYVDKAMKGVPAKSLGLNVPQPEEPPPATWWNAECDISLLVGIVKHGYEQFGLMRSDPALCFRALVGEEGPQTSSSSKKRKGRSAASNQVTGEDDEEEDWSGGDGEESEEEVAPAASHERVRRTRGSYVPREGGLCVWPPLADVNTRARRLVNAFLKHQKKEEQRQIQLQKEHNRRQKEAEVSRKKEQKRAELAQKWSKREEQDFARVVSFFGVVFNKQTNKYDWSKFRQLANLTKKSDERLTLYFHDFKEMCIRVLKRKSIRRGLSGVRVEAVNEEKAARCLQRIDLLSAVREEILPHPEFNELIKLCEASFEVPHWWAPVTHDKALLQGVDKHGLYRSDQLIYNDPELIFKETVPQTALFVPNTTPEPCEGEDGSGNEGGGNSPKTQSQSSETNAAAASATPIPLGWPKEKATVIRLTRIVYAFRNRVWPKPMDGLDLFVPVVGATSSSSESESEGMDDSEGLNDERDSESDYQVDMRDDVIASSKPGKGLGLVLHINSKKATEEESRVSPEVDVEEDRDFEIEKQQGLKITIKKSGPGLSLTGKDKEDEGGDMKLEIRIPLVKLSFASRAGMKRIPKKRPVDRGDSEGSPDPKRSKCEALDPTILKLSDLTGHEKVGVVNRNTQERLPLRQSPALKNLQLWLQGHPHYNVDSDWGPLVTEWGALKPDMYHRILTPGQPDYELVSD